jgi:hypothetical protein
MAAVVRIPAAAAAGGDSSLLLPVAGPVVAGTIVGDTVALRRNLCSTCLRAGKTVTATTETTSCGGFSAVDDGGWVDGCF